MNYKFLLEGPPRSGKTTIIKRVIKDLEMVYQLLGFFTPEIKKDGKRIGFDIQDIPSKKSFPFARKGKSNSSIPLGSYSIFLNRFNKYLEEIVPSLILNKSRNRIYIIDEIGKMELFSNVFQRFIEQIFNLDFNIIATIGSSVKHSIKNKLLKNSTIRTLNVSYENQDIIVREIKYVFLNMFE